MFRSLFTAFFGCSHERYTFPQTPKRRGSYSPASSATRHGTYVVCLDCGKELAYNWEEMRVGEPVTARASAPRTNEALAAVPVESGSWSSRR